MNLGLGFCQLDENDIKTKAGDGQKVVELWIESGAGCGGKF